MSNKIRVSITYVVELDMDSHEFARCNPTKKQIYYECCDTDKDDVALWDVTDDLFNGPEDVPAETRRRIINRVVAGINSVDLPDDDDKLLCNNCDAEMSDDDDVHGDNEDGLCASCLDDEDESEAKKLESMPMPTTVDKLASSFAEFMKVNTKN